MCQPNHLGSKPSEMKYIIAFCIIFYISFLKACFLGGLVDTFLVLTVYALTYINYEQCIFTAFY